MTETDAIRLDRLLHFLRLAKTRGLAQSIVSAGHVRVDGKPANKANTPVRCGQVITVPVAGQVRVLRLVSVPVRRGPATEAQACYEEISARLSLSAD